MRKMCMTQPWLYACIHRSAQCHGITGMIKVVWAVISNFMAGSIPLLFPYPKELPTAKPVADMFTWWTSVYITSQLEYNKASNQSRALTVTPMYCQIAARVRSPPVPIPDTYIPDNPCQIAKITSQITHAKLPELHPR